MYYIFKCKEKNQQIFKKNNINTICIFPQHKNKKIYIIYSTVSIKNHFKYVKNNKPTIIYTTKK